jgi:hypothetical protein
VDVRGLVRLVECRDGDVAMSSPQVSAARFLMLRRFSIVTATPTKGAP